MKQLAKKLLTLPNVVILDVESTGLNSFDQVIELAIIDTTGTVLLDTYVCPKDATICEEAFAVNGISEGRLRDAPTIVELDLANLLQGKIIAVYNAGFDSRLLRQSAEAHGDTALYAFLDSPCWASITQQPSPGKAFWLDLMAPYAQHWGDTTKRGYRWQSLGKACIQQELGAIAGAHSALNDARATLALIRKIAGE